MKPIKLKDLLTQTKKPETQQIEIIEHCKYEPYKDWKIRKWRLVERKMQLYISR